MKASSILLIGCAVVWLTGGSALGQFYAPETEFHDKAQRLFPVEAARVLAWNENPSNSPVCEITQSVAVNTNRVTTWKITWLDKNKQPLKEFKISYPESLLDQGPRYYREVFTQLRSQIGSSNAAISATELKAQYWAGADRNGAAREDGLRAALKLVSDKPALADGRVASMMAGLLIHNTLPSLCGGLTLDSVLLARGAAWLALAESSLKQAPEETWAPVLFLAGRETAARKLWTASYKATGKSSTALEAWWECMMRRPGAHAAFVFATRPDQARFGMAMMTWYSRIEYLGTPLAELLYALNRVPDLAAQHNYGWFFAASTDIGGGRLLEGALAAVSREEWRKLMVDFKPSAMDYRDYAQILTAARPVDPLKRPDPDDPSLTGFESIAPLLQHGYEQGEGPLIPVGVVTARELLNYGWEMNGMQMGARHHFVAKTWGIPDLGETIYARATRGISGQAPFFPASQQASAPGFDRSLNRLQWVDDIVWRCQVDMQPFARDSTDPAAARVFQRRCWLRPYYVRWQAWTFCMARLQAEIIPHLRRYHEECGLKSDIFSLEYLRESFSDRDYELAEFKGLKELKLELAKSLPDPTEPQIRLLHEDELKPLYSEQRGQKYEELFWKNPDCGLEQQILVCYINGGAWKSAKRFYTQVRRVVDKDVNFSNFSAPLAWTLGFLSNDDALMRMAFEDSDSGSYYAMLTQMWDAVARDKYTVAERYLDELIDRYESRSGPKSTGRVLKGFFPLMTALKDPKSKDHVKALDYFGQSDRGIVLRWILVQKYKLPPDEAIRFLGGKEVDRTRRVLALHLLGDKQHMHDAILDFQMKSENTGATRVLCHWVARKTLPVTLKVEEKDLMPPGAQSLRQAVLTARAKDGK